MPLVINVFNKKTVAVLKMHHFDETSTFVQNVTRMCNILNVKSPFVGVRRNDPDRCKISDSSDVRLQFLLDMAASFAEMDPRKLSSAMLIKMLTVDTSEALVLTL